MNCHGSQAAGSGDQSALAPPQNIEAAEDGRNVQQPQHNVRTIHGRLTVANARLAKSDIPVHGGREAQHAEAPSGTNSSGRQELRDRIQLQRRKILFTPPLWKARANGEQLQERSKSPTAKQSLRLSARLCMAALVPPAQRCVFSLEVVLYSLGQLRTITPIISLHLTNPSLSVV